MASSAILFSFFLGLSLHVSAYNPNATCPVTVCDANGPDIRFPFRASNSQPERCGFPGFNVTCNIRGQAILQLLDSQVFVVDLINYKEQYVVLKDPSNCLAKRLHNGTFASLVFTAQEYKSFTFADCPFDISVYGPERVGCLSEGSRTVVFAPADSYTWYYSTFRCWTWTVSVPVLPKHPRDITESIVLTWDVPDCRSCEESGGRCGFKGSAGSDVGCFDKPAPNRAGHRRRAELGILLGVTLPLLLCVSGVALHQSSRARASREALHQPPGGNNGENNAADIVSPSSPSRETRRASSGSTGIDLVTLETYPKMQVDDDGHVLKQNNNICAICLSEYQPKETLRTIPMCGHYFHAKCIDPWLMRNASCPLCRDLEGSSESMTASN